VSALLGLKKLDYPFGLGKIAAGGLSDATSVQIIHGIPAGATWKPSQEPGILQILNGLEN
jgi:hypothetical protein